MEISGYDRMHALARLPEFLADADHLLDKSLMEGDPRAEAEYDALNEVLVKKYQVSPEVLMEVEGYLLGKIDPDPDPDPEIQKEKDEWLRDYLNNVVFGVPVDIVFPDNLYRSPIWDGKYLMLKIDLTKKKGVIWDKLNRYINAYHISRFESAQQRIRENELDCWKIYDYHKKDGLSFAEITRKLWPTRGINTKTKKQDLLLLHGEHEKVRNAYKKAKNIIHQVKKRIRH